MKQHLIGQTGISVSALGLGTVKLGRNQQVKYPTAFDLPSDADFLELLDTAREEGVNLLDTAPAYGTSEERLGKLLGGSRDKWVVCSKAGEEFIDGRSSFDFSEEAITASVERSLVRLRTDHIDILLLHSDGEDLQVLNGSGALGALTNLKAAGKVRAIGISTKTVAGGLRAIELGLDAVMVMHHPWHREEEAVLDAAANSGTAILLKKVLGSGWFGADPAPIDPVGEALRFVFSHPAATAAIIGTLSPAHLRSNAAAARLVLED